MFLMVEASPTYSSYRIQAQSRDITERRMEKTMKIAILQAIIQGIRYRDSIN